jgi:hypothetical protein
MLKRPDTMRARRAEDSPARITPSSFHYDGLNMKGLSSK